MLSPSAWEMQEEEESFEVGVKGNAFMGCRSVRGCSVGNCFLAVSGLFCGKLFSGNFGLSLPYFKRGEFKRPEFW